MNKLTFGEIIGKGNPMITSTSNLRVVQTALTPTGHLKSIGPKEWGEDRSGVPKISSGTHASLSKAIRPRWTPIDLGV